MQWISREILPPRTDGDGFGTSVYLPPRAQTRFALPRNRSPFVGWCPAKEAKTNKSCLISFEGCCERDVINFAGSSRSWSFLSVCLGEVVEYHPSVIKMCYFPISSRNGFSGDGLPSVCMKYWLVLHERRLHRSNHNQSLLEENQFPSTQFRSDMQRRWRWIPFDYRSRPQKQQKGTICIDGAKLNQTMCTTTGRRD